MEKNKRLHPDVIICLVGMIFGALLMWEIHDYPADVQLFPKIFLILFMVFMGITLVQALLKSFNPDAYNASEWWCRLSTIRNPVITGAFVIVYVALIGILGFYISTAIYMLSAMFFFGSRSWKVNLLVTAIMLIFCYALFEKALSVTLPVGMLLEGILS